MRILIVEDLPDTRRWLAEIVLEAFPGAEIQEAVNASEGLEACENVQGPDLALIDLFLPDGPGIEVMRRLAVRHPESQRVVVSVVGDDASIVTALSAGAQGYLLKDQPRNVFARQLAQVVDGLPAISPPVARRIMEHFRMTGPCEKSEGVLTPREAEVLGLIARGYRVADTARALGIADGTAASHVKAVYRKLGIGTRAEAALQASRMGLL